MGQSNPVLGVSVVEEGDRLAITCKGGSGVGFALVGSAGTILVPIVAYILARPIDPSDLSFIYVVGPILTLVLFLGIRIILNRATIIANEAELVVKIRPLPLGPAKSVSAADLQSLAVKRTQDSPGSVHVTYAVIAFHRDSSITRLAKFRGMEFKDSAYFVKAKLEERLGVGG